MQIHKPQLYLAQRKQGSFIGLLISTMLIAAVIIALNSMAVLSYQQDIPSKIISIDMLDDQAVQTPQQALQQSDAQWQPLLDKGRQLGYNRGVLWFRLQFEPDSEYALELAAPYLNDVRFYVLNAQGELLHQVHTGDHQPFSKRPLASSSLLFPIQPEWMDPSYQYLFRVENTGSKMLSWHCCINVMYCMVFF